MTERSLTPLCLLQVTTPATKPGDKKKEKKQDKGPGVGGGVKEVSVKGPICITSEQCCASYFRIQANRGETYYKRVGMSTVTVTKK